MPDVLDFGPGQPRLEYRFAGERRPSGQTIVMLHEGLGSISMWRDFPERLAEATQCRVLAYSRQGYGNSSPLEQARTPAYMHEEARIWLPRVLERLGIDAPILFGHSDGASIALIAAAEERPTTTAVVALAPHVCVEDLTVESIARARVAFETTDLRTRLKRHHADVDGVFWGWNRIWLDPGFRDWNIERLLPKIRVPVLAIQGYDDEYGTLGQLDRICAALPATVCVKLADCGHSPYRDQPRAVLAATRDFILHLASGIGTGRAGRD